MDQGNERIATNIRKGVLEFCVLAMLSHRDMYGLELADELVSRGLSASEGSLYPLLARMQQAGFVGSRRETQPGGRPRKYYELTDAGAAQLTAFAQVWGRIAPQVADLLEGKS